MTKPRQITDGGGRRCAGWMLALWCVAGAVHADVPNHNFSYDTGWVTDPTVNQTWYVDQYDGTVGWVEYTLTTTLWMSGTLVSVDGTARDVTVQATADFTLTLPGGSHVTTIDPTALADLFLPDSNPVAFGVDPLAFDSVVRHTTDPDRATYEGTGQVPFVLTGSMVDLAPGPGWHNQLLNGGASPYGFVDDLKARFEEGTLYFRLQADLHVIVIPEGSTWGSAVFAAAFAWLAWRRHGRRRAD